jgi:hypothetical protein
MFRRLIGVALLMVVGPMSHAHDADRIDQLERRIQAIESQLFELTGSQVRPLETGEGWKSLSNWRSLRRGMRPIEVRGILGDAHRIDGGYFTRWHYQNGGIVVFANEEVNEWTEPRQ